MSYLFFAWLASIVFGLEVIIGTVRLLDAGIVTLAELAALVRGADLSALTNLWQDPKVRRARR